MHGKFLKNTKDFIESLEKSLKNMSLMKRKNIKYNVKMGRNL
ncbi:MAG: hypothetical protein U0457_20280 [Candidatus Sericytochromatia bacterium]